MERHGQVVGAPLLVSGAIDDEVVGAALLALELVGAAGHTPGDGLGVAAVRLFAPVQMDDGIEFGAGEVDLHGLTRAGLEGVNDVGPSARRVTPALVLVQGVERRARVGGDALSAEDELERAVAGVEFGEQGRGRRGGEGEVALGARGVAVDDQVVGPGVERPLDALVIALDTVFVVFFSIIGV